MATNILFIMLLIVGYTTANNMTRSYKGFWCDYKYECGELIGIHSLCIANECQCIPHYHINYDMVCVRDRGLDEYCMSDDECYWGPEMVDRLECDLGVCSCVQGYVPGPGRICVKYFSNSRSVGNIETISLITYITITSLSVLIPSIIC